MELNEIYEEQKALSEIVSPNEEQLYKRVNYTVLVYNARRHQLDDEEIYRTRAFLSSDLYSMIEVCYLPALDSLIDADFKLQKAEASTFEYELNKHINNGFSRSQAIELARKSQKGNMDYLDAYKYFNDCKNIVNVYDKSMKMGSQVLNSMSKRAKES